MSPAAPSHPAILWNSRVFGRRVENHVARYLRKQGLRLITHNYSCRQGEIDLVMRDRDGSLVFVEVRFRRDASYGSGLESVSWHKQQRLKQAAAYFLVCHGRYANLACRFDVVGVSRSEGNTRLNMEWIKNAFS